MRPLRTALTVLLLAAPALRASPPPSLDDDRFSCAQVAVCKPGEEAGLRCAVAAAVERCEATQRLGLSDRINRSGDPESSLFPAGLFIHNDGPEVGRPLSPQPRGKSCKYGAKTSHCSAFARHAARVVYGVELPPDPARTESHWCFLSDAQNDALHRGEKGFVALERPDGKPDPVRAQAEANRGKLVVASVKNPSGGAGHIALVLPDTLRSDEELARSGPEIVQAGRYNYSHTDALNGFWAHTKGGKEFFRVEYFAAPPGTK